MKFLFDLFPVILIFGAYKLTGILDFKPTGIFAAFDPPGIFVATAAAVAATFVQVGYVLARGRKVEPMLWVSLIVIVIFGGATLIFHDQTFIKWKPTILYWIFGLGLVAAQVFKKNLLRSVFGNQLELPDGAWVRLIWAWAGFFGAMGVLNLIVAYNFSTEVWVNFKLFGGMGLMFVFVVAQGFFLAKYLPQKDSGS